MTVVCSVVLVTFEGPCGGGEVLLRGQSIYAVGTLSDQDGPLALARCCHSFPQMSLKAGQDSRPLEDSNRLIS